MGVAVMEAAEPGTAERKVAGLAVAGLVIHPKHALRRVALQRRVSKPVPAIGLQQQIDEPVAQGAYAVEEEDGSALVRLTGHIFMVGAVRPVTLTRALRFTVGRVIHRAQVLLSRTDWFS